jgi:alkaline phosphatase D
MPKLSTFALSLPICTAALVITGCGAIGTRDVESMSTALIDAYDTNHDPNATDTCTDPGPRSAPVYIASGDVKDRTAVIWAKASGPGMMHVEYDRKPDFSSPKHRSVGPATEDNDFTMHLRLEKLKRGVPYYYRVWFGGCDPGPSKTGGFRAVPHPDVSARVTWTLGADVGGQNFCRRVGIGYQFFTSMKNLNPDFYLANGDNIYADLACTNPGPTPDWINVPGPPIGTANTKVDWTNTAQIREIFLNWYHYNWDDEHFKAFTAAVSNYSQWDDHEVINDFGLPWTYWQPASISRPGYPNLVREGLKWFRQYSPIDPTTTMYRSVKWGKDVEFFLLDNRSYRSRNDLIDSPENAKTMLGADQLAWLKSGVVNSTAIWKIIVNTSPLSTRVTAAGITPAAGEDAWCSGDSTLPTGFERELHDIMLAFDNASVKNVVWQGTDVHQAFAIRYDYDANGDGVPLTSHEFVAGPLSGIALPLQPVDTTFSPTRLFGLGATFNFGYYVVERDPDGSSHLRADHRFTDGTVIPGSQIDLVAK